MTINEDVIIDLYPLYESGEASEATQQLVESYLQQHPEFAKMLTSVNKNLDSLETISPQSTQEKETFMRVKRNLRIRSILFGIALFCTVMPLSMAGNSNEGVTWLMLRDAPAVAGLLGITAVFLWLAYAWTYR